MYEQFFGLKRPPFKITPDTSLFYEGGRRGDVLGALVYAVQRGEGIVKVVGEVGSGKTMLCRMLQQELPESVEIIYIANPSVSADDILFVIAHELKLDVQKDSSKHEVMHLLQTHLLNRFTGNRQVVLFVEEAQGMPLETLEEIRLLSNLETDQDKLLQIILFGQPELDDNLKTASIRQLKERITHEFNLTPFTEQEIHEYLNFRMREVGYTGPELISEKVAKVVAKYSGGLLRRINIIADKVLLSAFAESTHTVTVKHVNAAVKDSGFERSIDGKLTSDNKGVFLLLALLAVLLLWLVSQGTFNELIAFDAKIEKDQALTQEIALAPMLAQLESPRIKKDVLQSSNQRPIVGHDSAKLIKPESIEVSSSAYEVNSEITAKTKAVVVVSEVEVDQLAEIIIRKKKNSDLDELKKREKSHKKLKINKNSLLISSESTKITRKIADNNKEAALNNVDWLAWKIKQSKTWLSQQPNKGVSIQVMMRSKSASNELVEVLRGQWPLDVEKTFLYEVDMNGNQIYRVFFSGFSSLSLGQQELNKLPEEVRLNQPYLHSIYKMKKTLL